MQLRVLLIAGLVSLFGFGCEPDRGAEVDQQVMTDAELRQMGVDVAEAPDMGAEATAPTAKPDAAPKAIEPR